MQNRRKVLAGVAIGGLLITAILVTVPSKEPRYRGRSLSAWLAYSQSPGYNPYPRGVFALQKEAQRRAHLRETEEALNHIGTNAVPFLVNWLTYEPPPAAKTVDALLARFRLQWLQTPFAKRQRRAEAAMLAFDMLGTNAASAIPALGRVVCAPPPPSPNPTNAAAARAYMALLYIFNDATYAKRGGHRSPILEDALISTNPVVASVAKVTSRIDWGPPYRFHAVRVENGPFGNAGWHWELPSTNHTAPP